MESCWLPRRGTSTSYLIVLCTPRKSTDSTSKLKEFLLKRFYHLITCSDIVCSVAGITSDANVLTDELRLIAQRYELNYGEPIPVEQLVSHLCDIKQAYTQYGGKRPFGVSILYMGWDKHYGFQLYQSDPSGNYGGWKATCIGNNFNAAVSMLKTELTDNESIDLHKSKELAVKVLSKTLDTNKLTSERMEMATLRRVDNKTVIDIMKNTDVDGLISKHEAEIAAAEAAKKEKASSSSS